jgi:electron-transferring-flavoprotein dehydrogenase
MTPLNREAMNRETMDFDVVVVGAGPAGLAAALHLKQRAQKAGTALSVVVVEKSAAIGAHILSGAVIDPIGLDALVPDWREDKDAPLTTIVTEDRFLYLGPAGGVRLPNVIMPSLMNNHGNFIGSLSDVAQFLASRAETMGVEIYPGFAATEILYREDGAVIGIATGDMGVDKKGAPKDSFTRGMELHGKYVIFAEGAHGSLAKQLVKRFQLDAQSGPQKYGIGLKEVWRVRPEQFKAGLVQHSFGWPLDNKIGGGSFLYHYGDGLVSVGLVVHLNYSNPTLSPFDEFQRFKTHPMIRETFEGGTRLSYGARALTEGGWQAVPRLTFPGGCLIGCAAGFVNVPRIKGSHNAILSGMLAADHIFEALGKGRAQDEITSFENAWRGSAIGRDLFPVRNVKPLWSRFGTLSGVLMGGIDMHVQSWLGWSPFGTLRHGKADHECLKPLSRVTPKIYDKPDHQLTFDRLSSVFLSGTNHVEDQPVHLVLKDADVPIRDNLPLYGEPARLYCPAGVYEVIYQDESTRSHPRFVINAQNCVHCKTCDIKDPAQNITWVPPEGGGGPNYSGM